MFTRSLTGSEYCGASAESPDDERSHLGDPLVVPINVDDSETVMESGFGDQEIRDRRSMPHAVMMGKVLLKYQRAVEEIGRCRYHLEGIVESFLDPVIIGSRSRGIELLELPHRTHGERSRQFPELRRHPRICRARRGALVEEPARYCHISSPAMMSRSVAEASSVR